MHLVGMTLDESSVLREGPQIQSWTGSGGQGVVCGGWAGAPRRKGPAMRPLLAWEPDTWAASARCALLLLWDRGPFTRHPTSHSRELAPLVDLHHRAGARASAGHSISKEHVRL